MVEKKKNSNSLIELVFNVVIPVVILTKFSDPESLGVELGLYIALAFPIGYAIFEYAKQRTLNYLSVLGVISTLLTGGIALLELDNQWLAVKEALIPGLIATFVFVTGRLGKPILEKFLFMSGVLEQETLYKLLEEKRQFNAYKMIILRANLFLVYTFVFSSIMNYLLAKWIVVAPAGTEEFNEQLGYMMGLSYPAIAIPTMIAMFAILFYIFKQIGKLTGRTFSELVEG